MARRSTGPWWLKTYYQGKGCWVTTIGRKRHHLTGKGWLPESDPEGAQRWWLKLMEDKDPDRLKPKEYEPGVAVRKSVYLTSENAEKLAKLATDTQEKTGTNQPNENAEFNDAISLSFDARFGGKKKNPKKSAEGC